MARIVVQNEVDPGIAIVLEEVAEGTPERAQGWYGECTECGRKMHRWEQNRIVLSAQQHVDRHESGL